MGKMQWTALILVCACGIEASASGQTGTVLAGRLVNSLSGDPVADVAVSLEELQREARADRDGEFTFDKVPPGSYHISIRADGFSPRRSEVLVGTSPVTVTLSVDPVIHYAEVVSVSPEPRSPFESYQPTTVLAGQDLTKQLAGSLGATLENQPGVASRSFGPSAARPVIRGLDGDRVLILQDGQRTGDLSSQSGDHGVNVNPASAQRIEVVRGPATLLYGANAIGGLVNVITDQIPARRITGAEGSVTVDGGTGAREGGAAGEVLWGTGTIAMLIGGGGRGSGDYVTPEGQVENSQSRAGFANLGLSWTGTNAFVGGSYGYDNTKYGIPIIEEGALQLTPRRHALSLKAGTSEMDGLFSSMRAQLAVRRYRHDELEAAVVGTRFTNDTTEAEVLGTHRPIGALTGSLGASLLRRGFDAQGAEALSPPIDQRGFALFAYEEVTWPHFTFQFGGRVERTDFEPAGEASRDFTNLSGSLGVLFRPAAADDAVSVAASLARAARNPALEELFFFGEHHGNFAFEVGDPGLESEKALGFDVSLRWRSGRATGEITYFRNDVDDFIFRNELTEEEFEARETLFEERFAGRRIDHGGHGHGDEEAGLAFVEFTAADSVLQGIEGHADIRLVESLALEVGADYVRGSLKSRDAPLPRIPPFRVRGGLRYQYNAFQAGGEVTAVADQNRVFGAETPTDGYALVRLYGAYSFQTGGGVSTLTARLENATNELYRNHLSLIRTFVPEMGRSFRLLYNVRF